MKIYRFPFLYMLFISLLFTSCKETGKSKAQEATTKKVVARKENRILPSWNDTKTRQRIIDYVNAVTMQGGGFIPPDDRIAVFDNDGTLCSEQPTYFQVEFIIYRIKQLDKNHPEWRKDKLIRSAVNHDLKKLREKYGSKGLAKLMAIAQSGVTTDEFETIVKKWMKNAKHPVTGKPFGKMTFKPMLELISYLKENRFKVYIISGGGTDFMRVWATDVYGIPPENIIGSYSMLKYEKRNGKPVLIKEPQVLIVNDGPEKAKNIHRFIGKKPVVAFGNSDGDLQMLEWCASNKHKSLPAFIRHTDSKREWAYDRGSRVGRLNTGLDEAAKNGWLVIDMKKDWAVIHPD